MRISDWCSDVCSSDLGFQAAICTAGPAARLAASGKATAPAETVATLSATRVFFSMLPASNRAPSVGAPPGGKLLHRRRAAVEGGWSRRSEAHTSELQSLMRISYAVFCLKKQKNNNKT